ncbi:hypothetical protein ACUN24_11120 [Pedobacter sp. WC2501]|uniref:hypothetical protein n=1 Tax=Pedobacter sp. WC2501 TaxID=3461400 RepID=UPI004045BEA6
MKKLTYILIASLFLLLNNYAKAQVASFVSDFRVNSEFLTGAGKINLTKASTNTIKYKLQITRSLIAGTNNWNSTDISVGIGIYKDGKYVWLNGSTNVISSDFGQGKAFFEKEITVTIDNSKLTAGDKIYLVFENHPSNVSSSLWFKEAYLSINYGYDLPVIITPPPLPVEINGLVTYPSARNLTYINQPFPLPFENNPIGIKLPGENLDLKWDQTKLNTPEVFVSLFSTTSNVAITKIKITNNGSYSLNFSSLNLGFYFNSYYIKIENSAGNQYGKSGTFRFLNDHLPMWNGDFPSSYPNASWIFRPDSSGSYNGLYAFWFPGKINASNVIVDLYDSNGNFFKRLSESTPNTGAFYYQSNDNVIPRSSTSFYQYKITSKENPSEFGYSEVFNWWYD